MKQLKYLLILVSFGFLNFSTTEHTQKIFTTNCHQTFHFFFLSEWDPTFWIGEDNTGECEGSRLLQICINDSTICVAKSELKEFNNWVNLQTTFE